MSRLAPTLLVPLLATTALAGKLAAPVAAGRSAALTQMEWIKTPTGKLAPEGDGGTWILDGSRGKSFSEKLVIDDASPAGKAEGLVVTPSLDGKSAWVSYTFTVKILESNDGGKGPPAVWVPQENRVSMLVAETPSGWQILAGHRSVGVRDAEIAAAGPQGTFAAPTPLDSADSYPKALDDVVLALKAGKLEGFIADKATGFGSAPRERVKSGARKGWKAWGTSARVLGGVTGGMAPSGTTGWLTFTLAVHKKTRAGEEYDIPFAVTLVCDRQQDGSFKVVHEHFEVQFN